MTDTPDIRRPPASLIESFQNISTARICSVIARMGIRNIYISGPAARTPGRRIVGPALTLQFMPKREDVFGEDEYADRERQLHRHVLYHTQPGDVVVVDARGDLRSGVFGEMMISYFIGKGGVGLVVDGCIRDFPEVRKLDLGLWVTGVTPNFHTQTEIMPHAVNVPVACGAAYVMPGDIIIADDDGAIAVPSALAEEVAARASVFHEWEDFSREKLLAGGELRRYYPLAEEAYSEFEAWKEGRARE